MFRFNSMLNTVIFIIIIFVSIRKNKIIIIA